MEIRELEAHTGVTAKTIRCRFVLDLPEHKAREVAQRIEEFGEGFA